jgi:hypothetical protein
VITLVAARTHRTSLALAAVLVALMLGACLDITAPSEGPYAEPHSYGVAEQPLSFVPHMPYRDGSNVYITASWGAYGSHHTSRYTQYALDMVSWGSKDIIAVADGVVAYVQRGCANGGYIGNQCPWVSGHSGYGNSVVIDHGGGQYSRYGHLQAGSIPDYVQVGNRVCRGMRIGIEGDSGHVTGRHLHFHFQATPWSGDSIRFDRFQETSAIPRTGNVIRAGNPGRDSCPPVCTNQCTAGARRCEGNATEVCGDHDGNGCVEWGRRAGCGCGEFCEAGACVRDLDVCCPAAVAGSSGRFADIPDDHWSRPIAEHLASRGITSGCRPDQNLFCGSCRLSRGEAAAWAARALGSDPFFPVTPSFSDVPTTHPYYVEIETLNDAGLLDACDPQLGLFCPDDLIRRSDAASIIARAADLDLRESTEPVFSDVAEDAPYRAAVETLHRLCRVEPCGSDPLAFCPTDHATREGYGRMLTQALDLMGDGESAVCCGSAPVDISSPIFADVRQADPFAPAAEALFLHGVTRGCAEDPLMFCGECAVDRATAVTLIARAMQLDPLYPEAASFSDVDAEHPIYGALEALAGLDVSLACDADGLRFCPTAPLRRSELANLLSQVLRLTSDDTLDRAEPAEPYLDVPDFHPQRAHIDALATACIAVPCEGSADRFCPAATATRFELAAMLARAFELGELRNCIPPPPRVAAFGEVDFPVHATRWDENGEVILPGRDGGGNDGGDGAGSDGGYSQVSDGCAVAGGGLGARRGDGLPWLLLLGLGLALGLGRGGGRGRGPAGVRRPSSRRTSR